MPTLKRLKSLVRSTLGSREAAPRLYQPPPEADLSTLRVSSEYRHYHLGCGRCYVAGYLHVDGHHKVDIKEPGVPVPLEGLENAWFLRHNLQHGIPANDESLETIYHSHFLEHLNNKDGMKFLSECARCLKPGGTMRLAVPDFGLICRNYVEGNHDYFRWYRDAYLTQFEDQSFETDAVVIGAGMLYNWKHQMTYDFHTLWTRLSNLNFINIRKMEWGDSQNVPQIRALEPADCHRQIESLVVECVKGGESSA